MNMIAGIGGMDMAFELIGGLAMFLYGMGQLSDGLKRASGAKMRALLGNLTKYRVMGMFTGAGVTCLIQSSSATTVMVIGLINAGLLTLSQSIAIIVGANVGTTVTGWIVGVAAGFKTLKISTYALPLLAAGFGFQTLSRRRKFQTLGQVLLGLSLLFIGLSIMKDSIGDLGNKETSPVISMLMSIGDNPLLAVLAGAFFTMVVQSSSASIAMVIVAATAGGFGDNWDQAFRIAIPFVLGGNIGTTVTAQLAALQANISGKRAAMAHTLFNLLGTLIVLPLVYYGLYSQFIRMLMPGAVTSSTIGIYIALAHTVFNVASAVVALPLLGVLEWAVLRIIPMSKDANAVQPVTLETHLLDTPVLAMGQVRREIIKMTQAGQTAVDLALDTLTTRSLRALEKVQEIETTTDEYQEAITHYLVELSCRDLDESIAEELPVFMHSVNDIERIGDHATNVAEITQEMIEKGMELSPAAIGDLDRLRAEMDAMFANVIEALAHGDRAHAKAALKNEKMINHLEYQYRADHVDRMQNGKCQPNTGLLFVDCVQNLEKVGDHLANVAQGILTGGSWATELELPEPIAEIDN